MIESVLPAVITQLETVTALTGGVVVGMPERLDTLSNTPICWITGADESGNENYRATGPVAQRVETRIELTLGATGVTALNDLLGVLTDVRAALRGFVPITNARPMEFRRGGMVFSDPGWCCWREEYMTDYHEIAS